MFSKRTAVNSVLIFAVATCLVGAVFFGFETPGNCKSLGPESIFEQVNALVPNNIDSTSVPTVSIDSISSSTVMDEYVIVGENYSFVDGLFNSGAVDLQGDTYIDCGEVDPYLQEMTASIWIRTVAIDHGAVAIIGRGKYLYPFQIVLLSDNLIRCGIRTEGDVVRYLTGISQIQDNEWTNLIFTYSSGRMAFYINGILDRESTEVLGPLSYPIAGNKITIGGYPGDLEMFIGAVDEAKLFDYAIYEYEIAELQENPTITPLVSETKTLNSGETVVFTGVYTAHKGTINVDVTPETASWTLVGPQDFVLNSTGSATISDAPTGDYTITWMSLPGWALPVPTQYSFTLIKDGIEDVLAVYIQTVGDVTITTNEEVAEWSVIDSSMAEFTGQGSGHITDATAGNVGIAWGDVEGLETPADEQKLLVGGGVIEFIGNYTRQVGIVSVSVNIQSASWTLTDGDGVVTNWTGNQTIYDVPTGEIIITWQPLEGYDMPVATATVFMLSDSERIKISK